MPLINVKLVKGQATVEQKQQVVAGITDLAVRVMGRERNLTVVILDELEPGQWAIGGQTVAERRELRPVFFVNIKISKGTSHPAEMAAMMEATKALMAEILGNGEEANYFVIDELNPDAWGFDGIPMTVHNRKSDL